MMGLGSWMGCMRGLSSAQPGDQDLLNVVNVNLSIDNGSVFGMLFVDNGFLPFSK